MLWVSQCNRTKIKLTNTVTPRRHWGTPTDASAAMTAHRPLSSTMRSNDERRAAKTVNFLFYIFQQRQFSAKTIFQQRSCVEIPVTHLGLSRKLYDCSLYHFTTSQCILKCALLTFEIFVNLQSAGWHLKGGLFDPSRIGGIAECGGRAWAHSIARPWVPISSRLTHMV